MRPRLILLALMGLTLHTPAFAAPAPTMGHWAAAWAAAPQPVPPPASLAFTEIDNQTVRQTVRLTLGGNRLQVRFSNEYGTKPLRIGAASIAAGGLIRTLTFGGSATAIVPAGAPLLADPVELKVARMGEAVVSLYLPEKTKVETVHILGLHPTLVSGPGDFTQATDLPAVTARSEFRVFLSGVSVWTAQPTQVVATLGASIVDGFHSTPGAYANWPDRLAQRLAARPGTAVGVVNLGISGNMVMGEGTGPAALTRFDRDILSQPGLTHIILFEGRNDLNALTSAGEMANLVRGADAANLFAAYRQIVERAHQRGIKVIAAPVTPDSTAGWTPAKEAERKKLNAMVKASRLFDGFIDVDTPLQNPSALGLRPEYDSGDHLHPNDAGYQVIANSIDLGLFGK